MESTTNSEAGNKNHVQLNATPDWSRKSYSGGYEAVYFPEHPHAWSTGYIHTHRVVAELAIGRILDSSEIVHHKDGDRSNNNPGNLEITNRSSHARHHGLQQGKTMVRLNCSGCGSGFERRKGNDPSVKGNKRSFCSKSCYRKSLGGSNGK